MTEDEGVQLSGPTAEEVGIVLQPLTEGPAAGLDLGVDVLQRLVGPAQGGQPLEDGVSLLSVEYGGERPGMDRAVPRLGDLLQSDGVQPADVELGVAEDVVDEGHVGSHVRLLTHV